VLGSGDIDIYVISAEREHQGVPPAPSSRRAIPSDWAPYGWALAVTALASGAAWLTLPFFELANLVMVYLLGIVVVATRYGRGPSLIASILSVAALDFFFVPPVFTFAVTDVRYLFHVRGDAGRRARHQRAWPRGSACRPRRHASASGARPRSTR